MDYQLDEIDKRIIYRLSQDARNITASEVAEEMNVSSGTIRNRIRKIEKMGIVKGYHADINYDLVGKKLTYLFECSSPVREGEDLAEKALQIPGVVNVREIMTGQSGLHVKAVGRDVEDITQIAKRLSDLGVELENEELIRKEYHRPYKPFGPKKEDIQPVVGLRRISGNAETAGLTVSKNAVVAGKTLEEINQEDLIDKESLVVTIERENKIITPRGRTKIEAGDVVTIFSSEAISNRTLQAFSEKEAE